MPPFTMSLHCQTVIDAVLVYVDMPIALELWDSADEAIRDRLRSQARSELWHAVAQRSHRTLPHDCFDELPVWEQHADRCEVECVGGPMDGQRIKLGTPEPPPSLVLPAPFRLEYLVPSATEQPELLPTVMYRPLADEHGFFSRATDGAWRFGAVKRAA